MVRQVVGVALLTLLACGACSSAPIDTADPSGDETAASSVSIPLTTTVGTTLYRLNLATFTINGPALAGKPRTVKPVPDAVVHVESLPVGSYSIQLEKGWVLERRLESEKVFTAVAAQLVTPNPLTVEVTGKGTADAFFGFVTTSGDVALGNGSATIRIGVQDCAAYDQYSAQLAELTAQCLGTVDPFAYAVTKDGLLTPTFDKCPVDDSKLAKIRQLLSLQQRTVRLPYAKQCIAGRFAAVQQKLLSSGLVTKCPEWKKDHVVNPLNEDVIAKLEQQLPPLPGPDPQRPLEVVNQLKQNSVYVVGGDVDGQKCGTAQRCAVACAEAFPGFVVGVQGDNQVVTDPYAWLLETTFDAKEADPFLRATYYHPMSYSGTLPGAIFGDIARYEPCGPGISQTDCPAEQCSYWAGSHIKTRLQKDCVIEGDPETCNSFCGAPLP
jgi:hypothetical protein